MRTIEVTLGRGVVLDRLVHATNSLGETSADKNYVVVLGRRLGLCEFRVIDAGLSSEEGRKREGCGCDGGMSATQHSAVLYSEESAFVRATTWYEKPRTRIITAILHVTSRARP